MGICRHLFLSVQYKYLVGRGMYATNAITPTRKALFIELPLSFPRRAPQHQSALDPRACIRLSNKILQAAGSSDVEITDQTDWEGQGIAPRSTQYFGLVFIVKSSRPRMNDQLDGSVFRFGRLAQFVESPKIGQSTGCHRTVVMPE